MDHADAAAEDLAKRCAASVAERGRACRLLGIRLEEAGPGWARVRMSISEEMLNAGGTCHGGILFTLADEAFGIACNTHDQLAVATACQIDFLRPALAGEELIAEARERYLRGRTGLYDVEIRRAEDDELVASFRGKSARSREPVLPR